MTETKNDAVREASLRKFRKKAVIVGIMVPIALLHFITGSHYNGPYPGFVNGYLIDILLPLGAYFLLCLFDFSPLKYWFIRALLVFGFGVVVEVSQATRFPVFGRTFDPMDIVMYGTGVVLAVILDTVIFPRVFGFWTPTPTRIDASSALHPPQ